MADETGKGIYMAYKKAGPDFLGYRLAKLFVRIETPEDIALHNDVVGEVLLIVQGEEKPFFKEMAETLLYPPKEEKRRKRFLFRNRVADIILGIGQKKG